jgi:hypothetical protein
MDHEYIVLKGTNVIELFRADVQPNKIAEILVRVPATAPAQISTLTTMQGAATTSMQAPASTSTQALASVFALHTQQPQNTSEQAPRFVSDSVQQRAASHRIPIHMHDFIDKTPDHV